MSNDTLIADLVWQLFSFVEQNEHENRRWRRRQKDGIAAARARGVRFGRPSIKPPENFKDLVRRWEQGQLPIRELLAQSGLKEATFYRRLRELRNGGNNSGGARNI